jgi:hypothetical protein
MQFVHVDPARIEREWPVIAETVWPAVRQNSHTSLETFRKRLLNGLDHLFEVSGEATGYIAIELANDLCCWIKCGAGHVIGGPKQRVKTILAIMAHIEAVARDAGCAEIKICGRDWSKILKDYEPFDGFRNGIRKRF